MTERRCLYIIMAVAVLAAPLLSHAADEAADAKKAEDKAKAEAEKVLRDPFWPVNYVPPDPDAASKIRDLSKAPERWPKLELQGVSKTPTGHVALLKGIGLVSAGETLRLKRGQRIYTFKINAVTKNGISAKRVESKLIGGDKSGKTPAKGPSKGPAKGPSKGPAPAPIQPPVPGKTR